MRDSEAMFAPVGGRAACRADRARISVVIPTLDEESTVASALASAREAYERIVVDGGSSDRTVEIARKAGARVVVSARGRGRQLAVGADVAVGEILLFLHADSTLPSGFVPSVLHALTGPGRTWGRFDIRFDQAGPLLALIARLISWRSRLTRGATGDQAIFVWRHAYERIGGFAEGGFFEDVALCRRLKRDGRMGVAAGWVVTSSRRWRRDGTLRTTVRMWCLKALYLLGVRAGALERFYPDVR